jgi:hypothetical protein
MPMKAGRPARFDYEYQRNGTANLFMMFAPLEGWRHVKVTDRHTAVDYAHVLKDLADIHFAHAKTIAISSKSISPLGRERQRFVDSGPDRPRPDRRRARSGSKLHPRLSPRLPSRRADLGKTGHETCFLNRCMPRGPVQVPSRQSHGHRAERVPSRGTVFPMPERAQARTLG